MRTLVGSAFAAIGLVLSPWPDAVRAFGLATIGLGAVCGGLARWQPAQRTQRAEAATSAGSLASVAMRVA